MIIYTTLEMRSMQNSGIYHVAAQQPNTTYVFPGALPLDPAGGYAPRPPLSRVGYAPRPPLSRASRSFSFRSFVIYVKYLMCIFVILTAGANCMFYAKFGARSMSRLVFILI